MRDKSRPYRPGIWVGGGAGIWVGDQVVIRVGDRVGIRVGDRVEIRVDAWGITLGRGAIYRARCDLRRGAIQRACRDLRRWTIHCGRHALPSGMMVCVHRCNWSRGRPDHLDRRAACPGRAVRCLNHHDPMHMVGHYHEGVDLDTREALWQAFPNRANEFATLGEYDRAVKYRAEPALPISGAGGDEVRSDLAVVVPGETNRATTGQRHQSRSPASSSPALPRLPLSRTSRSATPRAARTVGGAWSWTGQAAQARTESIQSRAARFSVIPHLQRS
jgi:hypothetical protein